MKAERLHDILDLVLAANIQLEPQDTSITFDTSSFETNVYIHEHINKPDSRYTVYTTMIMCGDRSYDPELVLAESHINRLLEATE